MNSEVGSKAQVFMELAGLELPAEREAAVAAGLEGNSRRLAAALAARDYGHTEPASRFRPPASESK